VSGDNVEAVRSSYPAWKRGDFASADWADPEIESGWADGPSPGSRTGLAAMAERVRATSSMPGQMSALRSASTVNSTTNGCSSSSTLVGAAGRAVWTLGRGQDCRVPLRHP
jgi:hypothetical protein